MLLHTIGHSFGALGFGAPTNPRVTAVISGMQREHFDFMGRSATLAQFFDGYGISMIFILLFVSVQLWLLAKNPDKTMMVVMGVFLAVLVVCEYTYFFPMAALFSAFACILSSLSTYKLYYKKN
jgi:peptidoglycan biosynthesis protein MviN/MurJ (putative lipid II flippase)